MADFMKVSSTQAIPSGSMKTFTIGGKVIAIAHVDNEFFAIDDTCTHEQCSLGLEGFLVQKTVTCGCHGAMFDVTDGKVLALPATVDVQNYETKVDGDELFVKL